MKQTVPLIMIILFSQMGISQKNDDAYDSLWLNVQNLENDALTKTALESVRSISEKARKEKNSPQMVKALLYASKYALTLEEDAQLKIVTDFRAEIEKADFPTKNILESYLANMYWQYFQNNRYQFYNRTKTEVKIDPIDFRTWDLTTLFEEISHHFDASLANGDRLKTTLVSQFDELLHKQPNSENYRPTLFDLLAHNALQFYGTAENSITRPAEKFEIDNPEILCEADNFTALKIETTDATSLQVKALEIFQQLIRQHHRSSQPYLLAEVDLQRLHFIYRNATFENKEERFLEVLQNSANATVGSLASTLYTYEIAALYNQQGDAYIPKVSELHRWKKKEALELCDSVISAAQDSRGADKCLALKSDILTTSLQLTTEKFLPINKTSRLLVDYKNLSQLQFSARKVTDKQLVQLNDLYPQEKIRAFIEKLAVVKEWGVELKNENDHQNHRTEVSMPPLGNGQYLIFTFPKNTEDQTFAFSAIQVTDMALTETRSNTEHTFQVIDRLNGKPISGANLKLTFLKNYNRPYVTKSLETDKMGTVKIALDNESWSDVKVRVTKGGETANFGEFQINGRYNNNTNNSSSSLFLFTDRSIYRPGQPLYFKGIAVKNEDGVSSILENTQVTVDLLDVNYQVVGTQKMMTNDYGSFSGEFILPNSGLTGNFTLMATSTQMGLNGSTGFLVEEYKRPKFETFFDPIKESYKVNDSITVKGRAVAYAGSTISDAKVNYRVSRAVYFPRWYYWHFPYRNNAPQEIAHGETLSDASGNFEVNFSALPDTSAAKEGMPTFQYLVTADVTDVNGETHSTSTTVTVGYHTMTANMYLANPMDKDNKDNTLNISTANLNGVAVGAKGTVKMYKLEAPAYVLRPRPWQSADYEGFTKAEFKTLFPHDAFGNEHDPKNWEKGDLVWQSNFDTEKTTEIEFGQMKKWLSGNYILELETKDKFGMPVKDVTQVRLFGTSDTTLADNQLFEIKTDKVSYEIGDKAKITLLSAATDLNITVHVEKGGKVVDTRLIHLNNGLASFTVPVNEDDLGGFGISYSFSAYNAYQSGNLTIAVPYPVTALQIETVTFRDKLAPGSDETWSFKIKGAKGDKVSAELLASMYDSSLDAFRGHYWSFYPKRLSYYYATRYTNANQSYGTNSFNTYLDYDDYYAKEQYFDSFEWFGLYFGDGHMSYGYAGRMKRSGGDLQASSAMRMDDMELEESVADKLEGTVAGVSTTPAAPREAGADAPLGESLQVGSERYENGGSGEGEIQIRKNLQETAFFFPQLRTDAEGNVSFSFTSPEALTKWNLQLLAHTKTLESTVFDLQTVTQKELMVLPNAPRFLREGDEIVISTKIANLTAKRLIGEAKLELVDAVTGDNISKLLLTASGQADGKGVARQKGFEVDSMGNSQVSWRLKIPEGVQAVQYTVTAKAGAFSDGEQNLLPVLTNRMLVTETLPMWVRSNQTKTFTLDKLGTTSSASLKHHKLTLEVTSNPAWYAVQALPYLMEYPYECNEQTFSRYYSNSLASHIANNNPRIQDVFNQWASSDALLSNLEKNEELKSLLIQETPWLRDAQSQTEQKKRVALLFNLNKMKNEQAIALNKLKQNQKANGAWPWFNGGPANRYITQHIVTGLGHLAHLSVQSGDGDIAQMTQKAIAYLDDEFVREYEQMKKYASNLEDDHLSQMQIHYLYMRSFFKDIKTSKKVDGIIAYYKGQAQNYWIHKGLYPKGMLALVLHRMDDTITSTKILKGLEENSITSEELGMYWKSNTPSWYWYQAPIETQALLIEAFSEIQPTNVQTVDNLKIWLLKNKQTNQWSTTKATTEAVYALLLQGSDWLSVTDAVDVLVGGKKIEPSKLENVKVEAGTGYYKTSWNGTEIQPRMAEVQISKKGNGIAWGALYWQYFEDLDKITSAETPLKLKKKLFLKTNTDTGEVISEITEKTDLKVGDLVRVRIELRADRDMEFVHMKDMRAAGFEPINVLSRYKWQDGLGYYESTKDASTNFFFDYLPKGVFVFEYDLRVNNAGNFSNGITTIQCMYAPEFSSHSEGVRVLVGGQ